VFSKTNYAQIEEDTLPPKSKIITFISGGFGYLNAEEFYTRNTQDKTIDKFKDKGCYYLKGEWKPDRKRFGIGVTFFFSRICYNQLTNSFSNGNGVITPTKTEVVNLSNIGIGLRYNYYFVNKSDIQAYIGFGGGVKIPTQQKGTLVFAELLVGIREFITNHFALYAETGVAKTIVQVGGLFTF
jgi:hypothetical protein